MIAAIYARRSNEQPGVAEESKSVTRQIENARAFAASQGWVVDERYIFVDDGVRGSEFEKRRGYVALMSALKPRPPFQALIVSEQKSIGRESFETNYSIKQLALAGVNVVEYVKGRSLIPKTWLDKAMVAVEAAADEAHREKTSERMWESHKRLATRGYVTGARIYGYRNHDVFNGIDEHGRPLRSHVERVIEPSEAAVVRRIFALCAEGHGLKAIAKILNAEGLVSPRPRPGRPRAWAPSSVRCVLYRELYRGVNVWNKRRKSDSWGRLVTTMRPENEWIVAAAMPHLRIVSDDEWTAAHKRLQVTRARYIDAAKGRMNGRPPSNVAAKYLLSGLMQCGWCGASMVVRVGKHGLGRRAQYICAGYNDRGRTVCENNYRLSMAEADEAILSKISTYVLDPAVVEGAIARALDELRPSQEAVDTRRESILAEIRQIEGEQEKLVAALSVAGSVDVLARTLREREQQRTRLTTELSMLASAAQLTARDLKEVERDLLDRLKEWRELLGRRVSAARQIVSKLLDGRITWTPCKEDARYDYVGMVKLDAILAGTAFTTRMVPVRGFDTFRKSGDISETGIRGRSEIRPLAGLADQTTARLNRMLSWMRQVDALRRKTHLSLLAAARRSPA